MTDDLIHEILNYRIMNYFYAKNLKYNIKDRVVNSTKTDERSENKYFLQYSL